MRTSRWLRICMLLGFGLAGPLAAQSFERVQPKMPGDDGLVDAKAGKDTQDDNEKSSALAGVSDARMDAVLLNELTGIIFVNSSKDVKRGGVKNASGVVAAGSLAVLGEAEFAEQVASKYVGKALTLRQLNGLNRDVVAFLRNNGFPVVDVIIPEQDITAGAVQMIVLKAKVGDINITGNEHFDTGLLQAQIKSQAGELVTEEMILSDLNWINRNPFRQVNLQYSRGDRVGDTDLTFTVDDQYPLRYYIGYENSGTDATDENRMILGLNWGNAFGLDQQLNYQFTTAPSTNDFYAHSGSYLIPLPWRHTISLYGAYANSSAEVEAGLFDADGESSSLGFRYTVPLGAYENFNHELFAGYEYKYSENILTFGGSALPATKTEVSQFNIGYSAAMQDELGNTTLTATYFYSPGDMFSHDNSTSYQNVLFQGDAEYSYGRVTLKRMTRLPNDYSLLASITGQMSDGNLLVSEQLGAGGYASVRGYEEREANAEKGIVASLELRSPTLSISDHEIFGASLPGDQLQFLTFVDYATLDRHTPDTTSPSPQNYDLASAGVGLRYSIADNLSLRFDYGWQLKDSALGETGDSRGYLGVIFSY